VVLHLILQNSILWIFNINGPIRVEGNFFIIAFSTVIVTFISQNYAANKFEGCSKIIKYYLILQQFQNKQRIEKNILFNIF